MTPYQDSRLALPLAVFGFMLIIATGMDLILGNYQIPMVVSFIGLACLILAIYLRKRKLGS
ncbi:MAG: hypothetical protein R6U21_00920 [Thermoplasmatota archaeon]